MGAGSMRDRLLLAAFIAAAIVAATIFISTLVGTARHTVTVDHLKSVYDEAFHKSGCPGSSTKPRFISRADRKSLVAECTTTLSEDQVVSTHKAALEAGGFVIYEDRLGADGIWSTRACKNSVSVILYVGRVNGEVTIEQRALWSYADFKRLPEKCKAAEADS
jgi:hypothetical protein